LFTLLKEKYSHVKEPETKKKIDQAKIDMELKNIVLFSALWTFGAILTVEERESMNKLIICLVKSKEDANYVYNLDLRDRWGLDERMLFKMQVHEDFFNQALDASD